MKIVILRLGMRSETSLRLFSRAPRISMNSVKGGGSVGGWATWAGRQWYRHRREPRPRAGAGVAAGSHGASLHPRIGTEDRCPARPPCPARRCLGDSPTGSCRAARSCSPFCRSGTSWPGSSGTASSPASSAQAPSLRLQRRVSDPRDRDQHPRRGGALAPFVPIFSRLLLGREFRPANRRRVWLWVGRAGPRSARRGLRPDGSDGRPPRHARRVDRAVRGRAVDCRDRLERVLAGCACALHGPAQDQLPGLLVFAASMAIGEILVVTGDSCPTGSRRSCTRAGSSSARRSSGRDSASPAQHGARWAAPPPISRHGRSASCGRASGSDLGWRSGHPNFASSCA